MMNHFTAFVFWMRCIDLTTTSMRASWMWTQFWVLVS